MIIQLIVWWLKKNGYEYSINKLEKDKFELYITEYLGGNATNPKKILKVKKM